MRFFTSFPLTLSILLAASGCSLFQKTPPTTIPQPPKQMDKKHTSSPPTSPSPIKPDLANVSHQEKFTLAAEAKKQLAEDGFVVVPANWNEFSDLYSLNNHQNAPSFITTDALLHLYHLVFDQTLQQIETTYFVPALIDLCTKVLEKTLTDYQKAPLGQIKDAAARAVGFCAVALTQLNQKPVALPAEIQVLVDQEFALIEAKSGMAPSPLFNYHIPRTPLNIYEEDYTQYIPRGHYTRSPALERYFKAMMWLGRMNFSFDDDELVSSALILVRALQDPKLKQLWSSIYNPTAFLVGASDDTPLFELLPLAQKAFGKNIPLQALAGPKQFASFKKLLKDLPAPRINSMVIFTDNTGEFTAKALGTRFMGQRFVIDGAIIQKLIYPAVTAEAQPGTAEKNSSPFPDLSKERLLPLGIDIPAAFGSKEALKLVKEQSTPEILPSYLKQLDKVKTDLAKLSRDDWEGTVAAYWLSMLKTILSPAPVQAPFFMLTDAWNYKDLQTFLGSWAELKHDTILYAKEPYSGVGLAAPSPEKPDTRGYVEPRPELFEKLAHLSAMTKEKLSNFEILPPHLERVFEQITKLAQNCETIARKELDYQKLSKEEFDFIDGFGGTLGKIQYQLKEEASEVEPAALIADVATAPDRGTVLEVGIGNVNELYVVIPIDNKWRLTRGACYSYYEFEQPMSQRLTDEKWREMLKTNPQPVQPAWTTLFTISR